MTADVPVSLITALLCVSVGMEGVIGSACDCNCDCQQLRIENNLMKHLLIQGEAPVPDLRASFNELDPDSTTPALPLWTESLIISTYKTLITSQALTEIPIWWRNRQENSHAHLNRKFIINGIIKQGPLRISKV